MGKERRNKTGGASNCSTTESLCQSPSKDFASEVSHVGFKILRHWLGAASGEHCHAEPCHSDIAVPCADLLIGHLSCHCYPIHVCVWAKSLQSCPTLCKPMGCSPPGSKNTLHTSFLYLHLTIRPIVSLGNGMACKLPSGLGVIHTIKWRPLSFHKSTKGLSLVSRVPLFSV